MARVSLSDKGGQEYCITVPQRELRGDRLTRQSYRDKLDAVLDRIQDAIDAGNVPGEVV